MTEGQQRPKGRNAGLGRMDLVRISISLAPSHTIKPSIICHSWTPVPAEHWKHLRTTNPIESTFATVRHRTIRSKGCLSNRTALAMVFKLLEVAQKSWRRLDGHNQLPKLVLGVTFNDGIEVIAKPADRQPTTAAA